MESATHYEIHWSDNSNFSYLSGEKTVKASGKDVEEYDFVELFDVGSKYYFRLRAIADYEEFYVETGFGPIKAVNFIDSSGDYDGDGILDDGDFSGKVGDNPCAGRKRPRKL